MRIVIDNNILIQVLSPSIKGLSHPDTKQPLDSVSARAAALIATVSQSQGEVIIPTPVLAEFLVGVEQRQHAAYLNKINTVSCFQLAPFDDKAALECARLLSDQELHELSLGAVETAAKVKFDRQIIAITMAIRADELWTHDSGMSKVARRKGLTVKSLADIAPMPQQYNLL